ncbi:MAG: hypothetical protein M3437_14150 [Chloroflexota bacterium]|nr:hypothetical protein [Chloroflexota bacterium]MDQ5866390.1 hypothetical protein [Chloroflexota bacterium]
MLDTFTVEKFAPHVGDTFQVFYDDTSAVELTLGSAAEIGNESAREWSKSSGRAPFTLVFLGSPQFLLGQGMYRFEHAEMEPFVLFLVPIGPNEQGMQYEAIFT